MQTERLAIFVYILRRILAINLCNNLSRLNLKDEGPGYCHFPLDESKGYDEYYFKKGLDIAIYREYNIYHVPHIVAKD